MKTMRSSLMTFLAAALVSTSAFALAERRPRLTVHEGFLSSGEVDSIVRSIRLDSDSVGTYYGPTVLPRSISERLRNLGGTCGRGGGLHEEGEDEGEGEAVMTMLMASTTDRHRDCHVPQSEGRVVSRGDVAFVFLGSDPEAHFEHGDGDGAAVPVVKGDLVQFRGDVPHRTVVPPGSSVRIAGPFHLPTMEYVGSCPAECVGSDPDTCTGGKFWNRCECFGGTGRALKRDGAKDRAMDELRALSLSHGFLRNVAGQSRDLQCDYTCREGIGACCTSSGCDDTINNGLQQCMRLGGKFMGHGTKCTATKACPNLAHGLPPEDADTGLCCYPNNRNPIPAMRGYCRDILGQYFVPTGEKCPNSQDMGACCMQNKCIHTPNAACAGDWKGINTKCMSDCEGSCCSAEKCEIVTEKGVNDKITCVSGKFTLGGDCLAGSCPEKCQTTFDAAGIITLPSEGGITTVEGSTVGGENPKEYFEQCKGRDVLPAGSSWYKFTTPVGPGRMLTITTCSDVVSDASADHESRLSLYEGSCDELSCVTQLNSDTKNCTRGSGYTLQFCAEPGTEYKLMVHGYDSLCSGAEGNYALAVRDDGSCTDERPPGATRPPQRTGPPQRTRPPGRPDPPEECECECDEPSHWSGKGKGGTNWSGKGKGSTNWSREGSSGKGSSGKGRSSSRCGGKGKGKGSTNWSGKGKGKGSTNWSGKGKGGTSWGSESRSGKGSSGKGSGSGSRCVCGGKGKGKGGTTSSGKGKGGTNWSGKGKGKGSSSSHSWVWSSRPR